MVSLQAVVAVMALSGVGQTVLLDFYSDSCGPCRMMDPVVRQLAAQGYPVRQINVERERALAAQFQVQRIPCFVMIVDGREVSREIGMTSMRRLVQMCRMAQPATGQERSPVQLASQVPAASGASPASEGNHSFCTLPQPPSGSEAGIAATGWRGDPGTAGPGRPAKSDAELIAVSARLRIEDHDGWSCGSGTIIDAREGWALILTCGHIFRDSQGKGRIEVDLFGSSAAEKIVGELVSFDLTRDVGLVRIRVTGPVSVAPVAPPGMQLRQGDAIVTVGCSNGNPPSARHSHVTTLSKYLGPPNVEVADVPVVGRSGGGLFTPDGLVVGVCVAADPPGQEGFYAALGSIHAELDHAGLPHVYRSPAAAVPETALAVAAPPREAPQQMPRPGELQPLVRTSMPAATGGNVPAGNSLRLASEEQALVEQIDRRLGEGAEVICIIRSRNNPQGANEILTLERASAALREKLADKSRSEDPRHWTSLEIPRGGPPAGSPPQ